MDFEMYLKSKKIDPVLFKQYNVLKFTEWELLYKKCGAISFTQQKLFLINETRRKYTLTATEEVVESAVAKSSAPKPAFKPKFK